MRRLSKAIGACGVLLLAGVPAAGPPPLQAQPQDDWRSAVRRARLGATAEQFRASTSRALQAHPGDGFVLREYVLRWRDEARLARFVDLLDAADPGVTEGLPLEAADVAFLRGLALYYQQRSTSALRSFAEASRHRPGWNWSSFYRARILQERFGPAREYEPLFQAAFEDPDLRHLVLINRIYVERRHGYPGSRSLPQLEGSARERWTASSHAALRLASILPARPSTRDVYGAEIERLRQEHGILVEDEADVLAQAIVDYLPPQEALALLAELSREPGASVAWFVSRARLLWELGFVSRARDAIASIPAPNPDAQLLGLEMSEQIEPAQELRRRVDTLMREIFWSQAVGTATRILEDLGDVAQKDSLLRQAQAENPAASLEERLWKSVYSDPAGARALLDSLAGAEAGAVKLELPLRYARAMSGDVSLVNELEGTVEPLHFARTLAALAGVSFADPGQSAALGRRALETAPNHVPLLLGILRTAVSRGQMQLAGDADRRLQDLCGDCPVVIDAHLTYLMSADQTGIPALLERQLADPSLTPTLAVALIPAALAVQQQETADALLQRAVATQPDWRFVQAAQARWHLDRRELAEARPLVDRLAREFPGRASYRDLQLACGVALSEMSSGLEPGSGTVFEAFHHEFTSTAWIDTLRRAPPDTTAPAARRLSERHSYVLRDDGGYAHRERRVIEILSNEGSRALGVQTVDFRPHSGTPRVLVARVIQPDGSRQDIPRQDIVVSGVRDEQVDVDDLRRLSVP